MQSKQIRNNNPIKCFLKISQRYDDLGLMEAKVFVNEIALGKILNIYNNDNNIINISNLGLLCEIPASMISEVNRLILTQRIIFEPIILSINSDFEKQETLDFILNMVSEEIKPISMNSSDKTFRVRVYRHGHGVPKKLTPFFERMIGKKIVEKYGYKVDLKNPANIYYLEISKDKVIGGWGKPVSSIYEYIEKGPKDRPYFGVGVLDPVVARVMVNLTGAKRGELVYDPFCGMAGILIEASKLGMFAVGGDISRHKTMGAKINLEAEKCYSSDIIRHDALYNPVKRIKRIATDPPYAIGTKVFGKESPEELFTNFLINIKDVLLPGNRIVVALPTKVFEKIDLEKIGFKTLIEGKQKVHGGLTRLIRVITYARTN